MLYLVSASPRRAELLRQIDVAFTAFAVDTDESSFTDELPEAYVVRVARQKAVDAWHDVRRQNDWPVLTADTAVVVGTQILGKPENEAHGLAMLRLLSGATHTVMTCVCLRRGELERYQLHQSQVSFRALSDAEQLAYWQRGEGKDKAGAYAVQGYAARFITELKGSYSSVMGLPLHVVDTWLRDSEFFS